MKKTLATIMILSLMIFAVACGGTGNNGSVNNSSQDQTTGGSKEQAPVTLKIFNGKVEISEKLNEMKAEYEDTHPGVILQIESVMTSEYNSSLKAKFAGKEMPDIFLSGGNKDLEMWIENIEDLSDQPWVDNLLEMAKPAITLDGKIYGMPVNIEGYGLAYNKALFREAGIETLPRTLSELIEISEKLLEHGITPIAIGAQDWFSPGVHWTNVAIAQQPDPDAFIAGLIEGTEQIPGNPVFEQWVDMIDFALKYTDGNPLTIDYNSEITLFSNAEVAMIKAGNWSQVLVDNIDPNLEVGMLPIAINDDPSLSDKLYAAVPKYWVVNKDSEHKQLAKEFLNWLVTSETGQRYMTEEFQFIPGFDNFEATPEALGGLGTDLQNYLQEGKTLTWHWEKYPEGVTQDWGSSIQEYSAGRIDRAQLLQAFQDSWDKMNDKN